MSRSSLCYPEYGMAWSTPGSATYKEPCVVQCPDSVTTIKPAPVVVRKPGAMMITHPQQCSVGPAETPLAGAGNGVSFGFGGWCGHGGLYGDWCGSGGLDGYGSGYGYGGLYGYPPPYGSRGTCGTGVSCGRSLSGSCTPC
uniref:Keratin n=1 Tax=Pelodiscus sinensis TaxID=13735 RepID=K7F1K3_PELSI